MRSDAGLTLLELVAALAVFALVAVMGLQALTGSVRLQSRLSEIDARTLAVTRALTLLRYDVKAMVPVPFHDPNGKVLSAFVADQRAETFAVSRGTQLVLPGTTETGLGRAEWRLDQATGRLERRYWPDLRPSSMGEAGPQMEVLDGVVALSFRILTEDGWQDSADTDVPLAVDISLETRAYGTLRVVVAP